jgi:hypothetical protein
MPNTDRSDKTAGHGVRGVLLSLLVLAISLVLSLALAEGFLHILIPGSSGELFMYTTKSLRYKVMKPNNTAIAYGVPFHTNELGFRDAADVTKVAAKAPDEKRIVVLGDSFTASAGVPFDSIFTTIAGRELATRCKTSKIGVMNLGCGGYGILQYRYTLEESALSLSPDYVVLAIFVPNDFNDLATYRENRKIALGGIPASPPDWIDRLYINRAFGGYARRIYEVGSRLVNSPAKANSTPASVAADEEDQRAVNIKALVEMQKMLTERNIPFLAILLPESFDYAGQRQANSGIARICQSNHIDVIDMLPFFAASGRRPREFRINLIDAHPNKLYNQLVGTQLTEALASRLAKIGVSCSLRP